MLYINPSDLNIPLGIITSFTISAQKKKKKTLFKLYYGKWYFEGAHPKHAVKLISFGILYIHQNCMFVMFFMLYNLYMCI